MIDRTGTWVLARQVWKLPKGGGGGCNRLNPPPGSASEALHLISFNDNNNNIVRNIYLHSMEATANSMEKYFTHNYLQPVLQNLVCQATWLSND